MNRDMWLGVVRHVLTGLGGVFVTLGTIDADTANTLVGAAVTLGGIAWSVADKKGR